MLGKALQFFSGGLRAPSFKFYKDFEPAEFGFFVMK
jgi:hypothetical protein